jgi:hypothetical protein
MWLRWEKESQETTGETMQTEDRIDYWNNREPSTFVPSLYRVEGNRKIPMCICIEPGRVQPQCILHGLHSTVLEAGPVERDSARGRRGKHVTSPPISPSGGRGEREG